MAIDPVTAKILATAAKQAATSEKGKKAIGGIIIGGVAALLVILAIPVYILSHPLQFLGNLLGIGTSAYGAAEALKTDYDYIIPANNESVIQTGTYPLPIKGNVTVIAEYDADTHPGIDFAAALQSHVIAVADGTVEFSGNADGSNVIQIKHTGEDGRVFYSRYAHLLEIFVHEGEAVTARQVTGSSGGTSGNCPGCAAGVLLHFELRDEDDAAYDPYGDLFEPSEETSEAGSTD
ncbi:MAG: M23 family metallopeptidase [Oscillospiraceae bacterium]|nr:M23 family metallopeptidase [Oscillospiraceae bacterium]